MLKQIDTRNHPPCTQAIMQPRKHRQIQIMKIGMQTWGSHGDYRPMLALAEGLQAAGHEVTLVITIVNSADQQYLTSRHGVKIRMVASPVFSDEQAELMSRKVFGEKDPMKQLGLIMQHCFAPAEDAMFAAAQELARESDLLIGHYFMHPLQIAAEHAGKPYVSVLLSASVVPSRHVTPGNLPAWGQLGNRFFWWLARVGINHQIKKYSKRLRQQLGLPKPGDVVTQIWMSQYLTLLGVSPQLCPRQPDYPAHLHICGFLDTPNLSVEGQLPPDLATFLQAGPAPVYMTFGSMMPSDINNHTEALQLLTSAAQQAGCRAIIQSNLWQQCGHTQSSQILFIPAAPHHLVFPHCQAILHHGGAGTTQSATLAGKPSIVLAHMAEQVEWGKELQRRGIGSTPVERRNATVENVTQQLRMVLAQPEMQGRAQAVAQAMRQEDGVATAVRLIEGKFGGSPNHVL